MRDLAQWVVFRIVERRGRSTKEPIRPFGRKVEKAAVNRSSTWRGFDEAIAYARLHRLDGVGFVFTAEDDLTFIDLDHVRDVETGEIQPEAAQLIAMLDSYTEVSPSGDGVHLYVAGELPARVRHKIGDYFGPGTALELYDSRRFGCFTGRGLDGRDTIQSRQQQIDALCARLPKKGEKKAKTTNAVSKATAQPPSKDLPGEETDEQLFEAIVASKNGAKFERLHAGDWSGYPSPSEAVAAYCNFVWFRCGDRARVDKLYRASRLRQAIESDPERDDKWDDPRGDSTWGALTLDLACSGETRHGKASEIVARKSALTTAGAGGRVLTERAVAEQFIERASDVLIYVRKYNAWFEWTGSLWSRERYGAPERLYRVLSDDMLKTLSDDAESVKRAKWFGRARTEKDIIAMAKTIAPLPAERLDRDEMLLACPNATIDLRTGEVFEPRPRDYLTLGSLVRFDPGATCPRWDQFVLEIVDVEGAANATERADREQLASYLQRVAGYILSGSVREHALFLLYGPSGRNGKTTFLEILCDLLGDLARKVPFDMLLSRKGSGIPNDLASLVGVRMAYAAEAPSDPRLTFDTAKLKALAGGERLAARFMRGEYFNFEPRCKLVIATNDRPPLNHRDEAFLSRLHCIPFDAQFRGDRCDPDLRQQLKGELPGILNWALAGAKGWRALNGLRPPQCVIDARESFAEEVTAEPLDEFLSLRCETGPFETHRVKKKEFLAHYNKWAEAAGHSRLTNREMAAAMRRRGYRVLKSNGIEHWRELAVVRESESEGAQE